MQSRRKALAAAPDLGFVRRPRRYSVQVVDPCGRDRRPGNTIPMEGQRLVGEVAFLVITCGPQIIWGGAGETVERVVSAGRGRRDFTPRGPVPMFHQSVEIDARPVVTRDPNIVRSQRQDPGQGIVLGPQICARNDAPAPPVPMQDEGLPGGGAIVDRITNRPDIVLAHARDADKMVVMVSQARTSHRSPSPPIPMLGQGQLVSLGLIVDITHRPCVRR